MKTIKFLIIIYLTTCVNLLIAQHTVEVNTADSTGLPGDNFSLQGALDLFKSSTTLEEFEKKLNVEDNSVNNLDLNGDGNIDYIRVIDNKQDSAHAIVLQVPVSQSESQDIAVIEIEKMGKESATVQILGDEELYGENMIVEPFEEKITTKTQGGPSNSLVLPIRPIVNIWFWPCVQFIYVPTYVVWVSPWKWQYYPKYWKPWKPHSWRWHYQHCNHYKVHYYISYKHRVVVAHKIYAPHRKTSVIVNKRYKNNHVNYNSHRSNVNNKPNTNHRVKSNVNKNPKQVNRNSNSGQKSKGGNVRRK